MMHSLFMFVLGFASCMVFLYLYGKYRHQGHGKKATSGPSSKAYMNENVVSIVRKG